MSADKGPFSRDVKLVMTTVAMYSLLEGFILTVLQLYLKSIGFTGGAVGTFMLVQGMSASLTLIPFGIISDKVDRRMMMACGVTLTAIGLSIITNSPSPEVTISSAALLGIGSAMYLPCVPAIIADKIASDSMVKVYSIQSVLVNAIYGFSSLIGWMPELLVSSMGLGMSDAYRLSIMCLIPIGFGAAIPILCVSKPSNTRRAPFFSGIKGPVLRYTFTQMMIGFGAGLSIPLLSYYMSVKFAVESGPIGTLNAAVSFIAIPFYFFVPAIASRLGTLRAILIPQLASVPLMIMMTLCTDLAIASPFFIFRQIFMNMSTPLLTAFTMKMAEPEHRSTISAVTSVAWRVPNSAASQVGGVMMDKSLDSPLYATSMIYIVYIIVFYRLFRFWPSKDGDAPGATIGR